MKFKLDHVQLAIRADQEEEARNFYLRGMGLKEVEKPESLKGNGGFWMELPNSQLHIGLSDSEPEKSRKAHIALFTDDLNAARDLLTSLGCKIKEATTWPGCSRFETTDPFGHRLEVLSY